MRSLIAFTIVIFLWGLGLVTFADRVIESTPSVEPDASSDAIVVLTGKSDMRLKEGMRLLERRKGRKLLISGVNKAVTRKDIQAIAKGSDRLYDCCVDLGDKAENTVGNAQEISDWVQQYRFSDLIVVTSDYHMPRALLELKAVLPHASLHPYTITTPELGGRGWWRNKKGRDILLREYNKYLIILGRDLILNLSKAFGDKGHNQPAKAQTAQAQAAQAQAAQAQAAQSQAAQSQAAQSQGNTASQAQLSVSSAP
jgi:uncharacterized SAM-binding protein YcdF (DUF218 family)